MTVPKIGIDTSCICLLYINYTSDAVPSCPERLGVAPPPRPLIKKFKRHHSVKFDVSCKNIGLHSIIIIITTHHHHYPFLHIISGLSFLDKTFKFIQSLLMLRSTLRFFRSGARERFFHVGGGGAKMLTCLVIAQIWGRGKAYPSH